MTEKHHWSSRLRLPALCIALLILLIVAAPVGMLAGDEGDSTLTITKQIEPGDSSERFDFRIESDGVTIPDGAFSLGDGESQSFTVSAASGTFTIFEVEPTGWQLVDVTCNGITQSFNPAPQPAGEASYTVSFELGAGKVVDCTFTNQALDSDGDGTPDVGDNCTMVPNSDQANNDSDALGDACDADDDNDGAPDESDNCPFIANPDQADQDSDGLGDLCDADDDGDWVNDDADACPLRGDEGHGLNAAGCPAVIVCLADSLGAPLAGGTVSYYAGGWHDFGSTGPDGCAYNPILYNATSFAMGWQGSREQKDGIALFTNNRIDFATTPAVVQLVDSGGGTTLQGSASYYAGGWHAMGTTGLDGKASVELLPGAYSFTMSYAGSRQQVDGVGISGPSEAVDQLFQTAPAVVELKTCDGTPVPGGQASYYAGGWYNYPNPTDANGQTSVELLPGTYSFAVGINGTRQQVDGHNIASPASFTTTTVTLNAPYTISYYAGGWRTFTQPVMNLLPGTYLFSFNGTQVNLAVSGCAIGGDVVRVNLNHNGTPINDPAVQLQCGATSYTNTGGIDGSALYFLPSGSSLQCRARNGSVAGPTMTYNSADAQWDVDFYQGEVCVIESDGDPITNAEVHYLIPTNAFFPAVEPGANCAYFYYPDGFSTEVWANYRSSGSSHQTHTFSGADHTFTFQTARIEARLETCDHTPLPGGHVRFWANGTNPVLWLDPANAATDASGLVAGELFPGTHDFEMQYAGGSLEKSGIAIVPGTNAITWQTTTVTIGWPNAISYGGATGDAAWFNGPSMELLAGTYRFHFRGSNPDLRLDLTVGGCATDVGNLVQYSVTDPAGDLVESDRGSLECQGLGQLNGEGNFFTDRATLTCRGIWGSRRGDWFSFNTADGLLNYQFAGVDFTLYNGATILDAPHEMEIYGVGRFDSSSAPIILPAETTFRYRLRRGGIVNDWADKVFAQGPQEWRLEFATVTVTLFNGDDTLDAQHEVEVYGVGRYTNGQTFHVPPDVNLRYRLRRGGIVNDWRDVSFVAGENPWQLEFATVNVTLYNGDTTLSDPHEVEVYGVGRYTSGSTFHVPPGAELRYRLRRGGIVNDWLPVTFNVGENAWALQFATVNVTLYNGDDTLDAQHEVEVYGVGRYTSGSTFHVPPDVNLRYRLRRGGIVNDWGDVAFIAGDTDWRLEFATVTVSLVNDGDLLDAQHEVEVYGVGRYTNGQTFHVPPGAALSYRLRRGGIVNGWQPVTFVAGENPWELEFATVHVTLFNDVADDGIDEADKLSDPHEVEVYGVGRYTSGDVFHVPPDVNLRYRLRRGGIVNGWLDVSVRAEPGFPTGETAWELEFATVTVMLFNGAETLDGPHEVEVYGVGRYTSGDVFHVPPDVNLRYRLRRGGIVNDWQDVAVRAEPGFPAGETVWQLAFATVTFVFDLPANAAALIETEIYGYGRIASGQSVHLPPGVEVSFRARGGGWVWPASGWYRDAFDAGDSTVTWRLGVPVYTQP